ncbi:MAG: GNAT family N-acetyltransferase [Pseudomonadota bacterium]
MVRPTGVSITVGLPDHLRAEAAALYLEAFEAKLGPIIGRNQRAVDFLTAVMRPEAAIAAIADDGRLVGLAGFHDGTGGFIGGGWRDLAATFGRAGALWRAALLSLFERAPEGDELLMDGIVVHRDARSMGMGTRLLDAVAELGRERARSRVRLDVVDTNPRAQALYRNRGFMPIKTTHLRILKPLFGFGASTTMALPLTGPGSSAAGQDHGPQNDV